jgi:hypothetical protein
MYIIAKRKDYYDGVAGSTGIDKTIVYDRPVIEVEDNDIPVLFHRKRFMWGKTGESPFYKLQNHHLNKAFQKNYPHFAYFIIGFCGKLYIGWKLYRETPNNDCGSNYYRANDLVTDITYDFDYMKTIVDSKGWHGNFVDDVNYVKNYNALELFRMFRSPVFVYDDDYGRSYIGSCISNTHKFLVNPLLKDYEFYKVFDAFQAFQEIQMFISGVLGAGEKEIIEVADKYKITQHGFDFKWSFRKEPEERK